jgi:hypothetical protein
MNWQERYFSLNGIYHFVLITVCYLVLLWFSRNILINDLVFYNSYSEQLTYERALRLFEEMERLSWINYVAIPFVFLIKFILISIVLFIGIFFCSLNTSISFGSVFRTVIACEIVFVLAGMLKFLWFYFFVSDYDLNDLNFFYPLSLINLFRISEIDKVWIYPLQSVNLFQVIYILLLSSGLCITTRLRKTDSDKVVLLSYLPALSFWIVLIMFLSIDSSI